MFELEDVPEIISDEEFHARIDQFLDILFEALADEDFDLIDACLI